MPFNDYYQDIFNKVRKHLLKNKAKKWRDFQYHLITYFIPQVIFDWNHQRLYHIASFRNDASYLNNLIIEIMTIEKQIIDISDYQTELFTNNLTNEINNEKIFEYLIIEKKNQELAQVFKDIALDINLSRTFLAIKVININHINMIKFLTKNNYQDDKGNTLLHFACKWNRKPCIKTLLTLPWLDINSKNNNGATALHIAACQDSKILIPLLLSHGANPNITDNKGNTPLYYVLRSIRNKNYWIVVSILIIKILKVKHLIITLLRMPWLAKYIFHVSIILLLTVLMLILVITTAI